ncbi:MAG: hypothetical protein GXY74_15360 [Phycisphaerae bacterium]|nr:hypothetical protein [Phycisphaerae bacterium]
MENQNMPKGDTPPSSSLPLEAHRRGLSLDAYYQSLITLIGWEKQNFNHLLHLSLFFASAALFAWFKSRDDEGDGWTLMLIADVAFIIILAFFCRAARAYRLNYLYTHIRSKALDEVCDLSEFGERTATMIRTTDFGRGSEGLELYRIEKKRRPIRRIAWRVLSRTEFIILLFLLFALQPWSVLYVKPVKGWPDVPAWVWYWRAAIMAGNTTVMMVSSWFVYRLLLRKTLSYLEPQDGTRKRWRTVFRRVLRGLWNCCRACGRCVVAGMKRTRRSR